MNINFWLNGVNRHAEISPDTLLIDFLRKQGCFSVKRGCETANCGLCTVLMDGRPVLSCSTLAARIEGKKIVTLEGMQREAQEFGSFLANEGAEQCGFCNPGFIMNVFAMLIFHFVIICDKLFYEFAECFAGLLLFLPYTRVEICRDHGAQVLFICHRASSFPF